MEADCAFTGRRFEIEAQATILVTARLLTRCARRRARQSRETRGEAGLRSVPAIGDALAPDMIAAAVFAGRRHAEELEEVRVANAPPFRREVSALTDRV